MVADERRSKVVGGVEAQMNRMALMILKNLGRIPWVYGIGLGRL